MATFKIDNLPRNGLWEWYGKNQRKESTSALGVAAYAVDVVGDVRTEPL
jgi:hypothetical protein